MVPLKPKGNDYLFNSCQGSVLGHSAPYCIAALAKNISQNILLDSVFQNLFAHLRMINQLCYFLIEYVRLLLVAELSLIEFYF
ncbi:unnamed protein product [Schistosoma spindalis]|nr:unnamed protein product [Schistosoma spindale]